MFIIGSNSIRPGFGNCGASIFRRRRCQVLGKRGGAGGIIMRLLILGAGVGRRRDWPGDVFDGMMALQLMREKGMNRSESGQS